MQVGDLIKPKESLTFSALGYAIITKYQKDKIVIFWLDDESYTEMRDSYIIEHMEVV